MSIEYASEALAIDLRRHITAGLQNRWVIAVASCLVQLALGTVYASSVLLGAIMERYHVGQTAAGLTFTLNILALGITAGFGGTLQRRYGPRAIATAGGILYGIGVALAGVAPSLTLFYVAYGLVAGVGLGLGYIVPLAMLLRWFPDKRGLISGLAVCGFGAGAMVVSPLATHMLGTLGLGATLVDLGLSYFVIVVAAAQLFRAAPEGYRPAGWTTPPDRNDGNFRHYALAEALRSPRWYVLWLILALNVSAGAALISVAVPLVEQMSGVDASVAALSVMAISVTNGAGRPFWGWASDRLGRTNTFAILFTIQFLAFCALALVSSFPLLLLIAAVVGLCFGGGFAAMPAFTADFFGSRNAGAIYGAMLTAWGAGSVIGPMLITSLDYRDAAWVIAFLMMASIPLALIAHPCRLAALRSATVRVRRFDVVPNSVPSVVPH